MVQAVENVLEDSESVVSSRIAIQAQIPLISMTRTFRILVFHRLIPEQVQSRTQLTNVQMVNKNP